MKVQDPAGQTWRVSRRWVPWRRRLKGLVDGPDLPTGLGDDPVSVVIGVLCLVLLIPFLVVALVAGIELLLLLLVFPFALIGRIMFGRHWAVEVRQGWQPFWEREVGTWRASRDRILEIGNAIREGRLPPRNLDRQRAVTES